MDKPSVTSMAAPLDPEQLKETIARAKVQLRKRMKSLRSGHSRSVLALRSERIVQRLMALPQMEQASSVALFWPMLERGEVDLRALDTQLRETGKRIFYPFMVEKESGRFSTGFAATDSPADLELSRQGYMQPILPNPAQPGEVDLVIVPALAADVRGHRIGYGAGFYDATLQDIRPPAQMIIVAYHFQLLAELPNEAHDQAGDAVVTDEAEYWVEG